MSVGIDGAAVLLLVETAPDVFAPVGAQTGLSRDSTRNMIDTSNKDHDHTRWIYGKKDDTVTLESLYVPDDDGLKALREAQQNKDTIIIRRSEDGIEIEEATALISSIADDFPDNDVATVSVELQLDSDWTAVP